MAQAAALEPITAVAAPRGLWRMVALLCVTHAMASASFLVNVVLVSGVKATLGIDDTAVSLLNGAAYALPARSRRARRRRGRARMADAQPPRTGVRGRGRGRAARRGVRVGHRRAPARGGAGGDPRRRAGADYVASAGDHYQDEVPRPWPDVVEDVRRAVQAVIDDQGAFVTSGDVAAFVCR